MEHVPLNIWLLFYCSDKTDLFSTNRIKYYFLSAWSTVPLKVKIYKEINSLTCFCFTSDKILSKDNLGINSESRKEESLDTYTLLSLCFSMQTNDTSTYLKLNINPAKVHFLDPGQIQMCISCTDS